MNTVIKKEETIIEMLERKDPFANKALENLFIRFERDNHLRPTIRCCSTPSIWKRPTKNAGN